MVFPSVPIYLDPPNWNQQLHAHQPSNGGGGVSSEAQQQLAPLPQPESAGTGGSVPRPISMAERARLAKVPQPEAALKCPRCDSTNTKFCYFNNYSLSQPRHFCKTCRRYWTRGGALRSVPVGGGYRRNKRSKATGSASKSTATAASSSSTASSAASAGAIPSSIMLPPQLPPFISSLLPLNDYGASNISMSFAGVQPLDSPSIGLEQWRLQQSQQFPLFGGLEAPAQGPALGLYPFDGEGGYTAAHLGSVKMEDDSQAPSFSRQYLGNIRGSDQYWGIGGSAGDGGSSAAVGVSGSSAWMTDFSGFNASSSGNFM